MKYFVLLSLLAVTMILAAQVQSSGELNLEPTSFSHYLQDNFQDYISDTVEWVRENRVYRGEDKELEVRLNSPFELQPESPTGKSVLLIHGLSDSPYSFADVAQRLANQGFLVRTLLLPGHGAKPVDLMLPSINDWLAVIDHHTNMLLKESSEVWLGGFSTGANLAMIEAIDNPDVSGTLLFSPAIVSRKPLDFLAPWAKYLVDWADIDPEVSITRFDSLTMNGAALYYQSSQQVRERLEASGFDRPVLVTLSERDSVVDSEAVYAYFNEYFTHTDNTLIWFGERTWTDPKVIAFSMSLSDKRISTGSHMSVLYSPENPYYGEQGAIKICNNGQSPESEEACENGAKTWYSSFDYVEEGKIHARLTWNPYFDETLEAMLSLLNASSANALADGLL